MAKLKQHKPVGEDYLADKPVVVTHAFPFPPSAVWAALLDGPAWTEWLPITKVTWTSPQPFAIGTTRTVEIGPQVIEETFFGWEEGARMAFRFERSTLPVSAAVEDYRVVPTATGCELRWAGKASAMWPLAGLINKQLADSLKAGMPKLEALIAGDPKRFGLG